MASKPTDFMKPAARAKTCTRSRIWGTLISHEIASPSVSPIGLNAREGPSGRLPWNLGFLVNVPQWPS